MVSQKVIRHVSTALVLIGFLFTILATAGNYWYEYDTLDIHGGLWKDCSGDHCVNNDSDADWRRAVQVFMILSCVSYGFGIVYAILIHVRTDLGPKFLGVIVLSAAVFSLIGMSVYSGEAGRRGHYGWSYALGWVGMAVTVIGGVLLFVGSSYEQIE